MPESEMKTASERRMDALLVKYLYREMSEYELAAFQSELNKDPALRGRLETLERAMALLGEIPARAGSAHLVADIQAEVRRQWKGKPVDAEAPPASLAPGEPGELVEPVESEGTREPVETEEVERPREARKHRRSSWEKTWLPLLIGGVLALVLVGIVWALYFRKG